MSDKQWQVTDITNAKRVGILEFQDNKGEWHNFEVLETADKMIFGGMTNCGFLERGYIEKTGLLDVLPDLLADLETYYNDGPGYTSAIVVNDRM